MAAEDSSRAQSLVRGVTGGIAVGLGLGLVDALFSATLIHQEVAFESSLRLVAAWVTSYAVVVAVGSLGLALTLTLAHVIEKWRAQQRWIGSLAIALALAGLFVDKLAYVNLYPHFHTLLAVAYVTSALIGGTCFAPRRWHGLVGALGILLAIAASLLGPSLLDQRQDLRAIFSERSTIGRLIAPSWNWPEAPEFADLECAWPLPAQEASSWQKARGYNLLIVSIDAVRGDLAGERIGEIWPEIVQALPKAVRFDWAYAAATRTTESLFALHTGQWPHRLELLPSVVDEHDRFRVLEHDDPRVLDPQSWRQHHPLPIRDQHRTLAEALHDAGYFTVAGAASLFFLRDAGITRGFARIDDSAYAGVRNKTIPAEDFSSAALTDGLIRWLTHEAREPANAPWFAWAHYMDPHAPYRDKVEGASELPAPARYVGEIRRASREIGRLLTHLTARQLLDQTIVVVTSDHGEEFRDHGGLLHGTTVYDELLHVPLLIAVPGIEARVVQQRVSLVDLFPTVVDLLGVANPPKLDGQSLVPLLLGQPRAEQPILGLATLNGRKSAILSGPYKLIRDHRTESLALFHLTQDPKESRNIVDQEPEIVNELGCLLRASGIFSGDR